MGVDPVDKAAATSPRDAANVEARRRRPPRRTTTPDGSYGGRTQAQQAASSDSLMMSGMRDGSLRPSSGAASVWWGEDPAPRSRYGVVLGVLVDRPARPRGPRRGGGRRTTSCRSVEPWFSTPRRPLDLAAPRVLRRPGRCSAGRGHLTARSALARRVTCGACADAEGCQPTSLPRATESDQVVAAAVSRSVRRSVDHDVVRRIGVARWRRRDLRPKIARSRRYCGVRSPAPDDDRIRRRGQLYSRATEATSGQ